MDDAFSGAIVYIDIRLITHSYTAYFDNESSGSVAKYKFHCRILTHFGYTRKRIQSSDEKLDAAIREVHQEKGEESIGMRRMTYILRYIVYSTY